MACHCGKAPRRPSTPLWCSAGGAQQPNADRVAGTAREQTAKRKRPRTYPELAVANLLCSPGGLQQVQPPGRCLPSAVGQGSESLARLRPAALSGDLLADARDAEAVPTNRSPPRETHPVVHRRRAGHVAAR